MKLSDEIIKDKSLMDYARKLDPNYYQDHFNNAWILFRTKEIEEIGFTEKVKNSYKGYFVTILKNVFIDSKRRENFYCKSTTEDTATIDVDYQKIHNWFSSNNHNEEDTILKNIIEIVSKTNTITEAIELTGIPRRAFYDLYKKGKIKFKNECIY